MDFLCCWLTATNTVFINFYLIRQGIELAISNGPWELAENYNTDIVLCIIEYATEIKQASKLQENFLTFAVNSPKIQNPTNYQALN
jgi:hypothetical protein